MKDILVPQPLALSAQTTHYEVSRKVEPVVLANRLSEDNLPEDMAVSYRGVTHRFRTAAERYHFVAGINIGLGE